jgi:hypothetical protein
MNIKNILTAVLFCHFILTLTGCSGSRNMGMYNIGDNQHKQQECWNSAYYHFNQASNTTMSPNIETLSHNQYKAFKYVQAAQALLAPHIPQGAVTARNAKLSWKAAETEMRQLKNDCAHLKQLDPAIAMIDEAIHSPNSSIWSKLMIPRNIQEIPATIWDDTILPLTYRYHNEVIPYVAVAWEDTAKAAEAASGITQFDKAKILWEEAAVEAKQAAALTPQASSLLIETIKKVKAGTMPSYPRFGAITTVLYSIIPGVTAGYKESAKAKAELSAGAKAAAAAKEEATIKVKEEAAVK